MRTLPALTGLALLASTTGCTATFTRLGGTEGPFDLRPKEVTYRELGHVGPDRLLARSGTDDVLLLQGGKARQVKDWSFPPSRVQVVGRKVVYRRGDALFERAAKGGEERKILELPGLRRYLVTPERVFLADEHALYQTAYPKPKTPRLFLSGRVEALAWDPIRKLVWATQSEPFAVIEALDPATRRSRYLVPLPLELEGGDLEVLCSGGNLAIYAHDRPLEAGLLLQPKTGHVWRLYEGSLRPPSARGAGPRVLTPPGRIVDGRISLGLHDAQPTFGRVAPFPGGRFLVVDDRETAGGPSLNILTPVKTGDVAPGLEQHPAPDDLPRTVQGLAWDEEGVTLIANNQVLRVTPNDFRDHRIHAHPGYLARRILNTAFWVPLTALETAGAFALNCVAAAAAVPFSSVALVTGEPEAFAYMITSPIWLPFGGTFGFPTLLTTDGN